MAVRRCLVFLTGLMLTVGVSTRTEAAEILYALTLGGDGLWTLDPEDASKMTWVAVSNKENLNGLTWYPGRGLLSIDGWNDASDDRLFHVDHTTGAGTVVGDTGDNWNFRFIEYNPANGVLYGGTDNELYTINADTGLATKVADITGSGLDQATALAIDGSGNAYITDMDDTSLFSLDLTTGAATHLTDLRPGGTTGCYDALAFNETGLLYGSGVFPGYGGALVETIDVSTYDRTLLQGFGGYQAFAFGPDPAAVPEPSALVTLTGLLGMGLIGHWWRRRRR